MNKLEQLIKKIEGMDRLADCEYKAEDGCMCAVGVMMEDYGILDMVAGDHYRNTTDIPELVAEGIAVEPMAIHYGLSVGDLEELQSINDGSLNETRKGRVLTYLRGKLVDLDD